MKVCYTRESIKIGALFKLTMNEKHMFHSDFVHSRVSDNIRRYAYKNNSTIWRR